MADVRFINSVFFSTWKMTLISKINYKKPVALPSINKDSLQAL